MISGCIDKVRNDACGGCERRDACSRLAEMFGFRRRDRADRPGTRPRPAGRNPFLAFLGEFAEAVAARAKPPESAFRRQVEQHLEPLLASGRIGIAAVARELGYSRQTLYRRLKAEGVTFEQLLDGLRRRLALRFLREQGLSVKETAYRLGFSDPAAFSRAFKRWTGESPRSMRGDKGRGDEG